MHQAAIQVDVVPGQDNLLAGAQPGPRRKLNFQAMPAGMLNDDADDIFGNTRDQRVGGFGLCRQLDLLACDRVHLDCLKQSCVL